MLLQVTTDFTEGYASKDVTELKWQELAKVVAKKRKGTAELDKEYRDRASQKEIKSRK